jgi:hypothetical protein
MITMSSPRRTAEASDTRSAHISRELRRYSATEAGPWRRPPLGTRPARSIRRPGAGLRRRRRCRRGRRPHRHSAPWLRPVLLPSTTCSRHASRAELSPGAISPDARLGPEESVTTAAARARVVHSGRRQLPPASITRCPGDVRPRWQTHCLLTHGCVRYLQIRPRYRPASCRRGCSRSALSAERSPSCRGFPSGCRRRPR